MAMIINDMAGYSTVGITPDEVNSTVDYSCNFFATNYASAFSEYIVLNNYRTTTISYTGNEITQLIAPSIDNDTLAIIRGKRTEINNEGKEITYTHYVVVNGYTYSEKRYDDDRVVRNYTGLIITDPGGANRSYSGFISLFPTITDYAVFSKK
ncbi:MAG: hypothetical protein E7191_03065 [Erysipelotrichaceae bacterium]|nr:hypothetical protein [Erysipelotrichaceae bacterium]